jgi:divalent metal cation (Fe/Co/Zn/Cd) transporter
MGLIGAAIGLLLFIIIIGVLWYCVQRLLALIPLPEPFRTIVDVILILVVAFIVIAVVIWLLGIVGVHVNMPLGMR